MYFVPCAAACGFVCSIATGGFWGIGSAHRAGAAKLKGREGCVSDRLVIFRWLPYWYIVGTHDM